jgi:hypothetical protein
MKRFLPVFLLLVGCGDFKKDVQSICDAANDGTVLAAAGPERVKALGEAMGKNVDSSDGKKLVTTLNGAPNDVKSKILQAEASKAGLKRCATADFFAAQ